MSRNIRIKARSGIKGSIRVPGDKSISHRVAMLAAIADGVSEISGFASSVDCWATIDCVRRLGIQTECLGDTLLIHGQGLRGLRPTTETFAGDNLVRLYVGNSGTTIRLISGLLAGQNFNSLVDGDKSIRRRPMRRVMEPLQLMGAKLAGRDDNFAPLTILGSPLKAIQYETPIASAQVKSCVLFAGLYADGKTSVREPSASRNHSEIILKEFGARIEVVQEENLVHITGGFELQPVLYEVPGDVSSAAFFVAAATVLAGSNLKIQAVNLNESRTAFLDVLSSFGASISRENVRVCHGEMIGDLQVESHSLNTGGKVAILAADRIPNLIDELPILAVIGTQMDGRLEVRDAKELRVKESDRIATVVNGLRAMDAKVEEFADGFAIEGPQKMKGAKIETYGDHRIAMAFSIAGLLADGETEIVGADCAEVSFPEFYSTLKSVTREDIIEF